MNQRTQYLIQVLEKIGAPLMSAILQTPDRVGNPQPDAANDAQRMAELLARATQASIEMSGAVDFGPAREQSDSLRVALAALASELVGASYKTSGKVPAENDLRRMTAAMQTVLTWSENFMPAPDAALRMENLRALGQPVDPQQTLLQYISAFAPVVSAVTIFPFGQPEQKLIMDITQRLVQKSADMTQTLFGALEDGDRKRAELSLLTSLAGIYAACHSAETARLMALSPEQASAGPGLDSVWKAFDIRVALVEAMARQLVPGTAGQSSSTGSKAYAAEPAPVQPLPAAPPASPPAQQPSAPAGSFTLPPTTPPPAAPPVFTQVQTPTPPPSNPLSMFAKKPPDSTGSPPAAPPSDTPQQPPTGGAGGPMSFFKKDDGKKE